MSTLRLCKMCQSPISGRRDKIYCSDRCKSDYHEKLTKVTNIASASIEQDSPLQPLNITRDHGQKRNPKENTQNRTG